MINILRFIMKSSSSSKEIITTFTQSTTELRKSITSSNPDNNTYPLSGLLFNNISSSTQNILRQGLTIPRHMFRPTGRY